MNFKHHFYLIICVAFACTETKKEPEMQAEVPPEIEHPADTVDRITELPGDTVTVVKMDFREVIPDSISDYIEALQNRINTLNGEVDSYKLAENDQGKEAVLEVDPRVHKMVVSFLESWENLVDSGDPDIVLDFFLPEFQINGVNVDTTYSPSLVSADHFNFKKRLKAITKLEGQDTDYGDPKFLYADIKGEIFTVTFTTIERTLMDGQEKFASDILITFTGRIQETPKIALYNWVNMANPR